MIIIWSQVLQKQAALIGEWLRFHSHPESLIRKLCTMHLNRMGEASCGYGMLCIYVRQRHLFTNWLEAEWDLSGWFPWNPRSVKLCRVTTGFEAERRPLGSGLAVLPENWWSFCVFSMTRNYTWIIRGALAIFTLLMLQSSTSGIGMKQAPIIYRAVHIFRGFSHIPCGIHQWFRFQHPLSECRLSLGN